MASATPEVTASIAPSDGAGRDAERERCGQRIPEQRLEDDAGGGEAGADDDGGEHAWKPRDEEDLRVDVVGKRQRRIERAPQADRRAADERSDKAADDREARRKTRCRRPGGAAPVATSRARHRRRPSRLRSCRADRDHRQMARAFVRGDVRLDAVHGADVGAGQDALGRTRVDHASVPQQDQRTARPTRRNSDRASRGRS